LKKLLCGTASFFLGATFLFSPISVFAEETSANYTPFSIEVGGTGSTNLPDLKTNLEIPNVIDSTSGDSTTDTMSQRAIKQAIAAGSGGGIIVTDDPGPSVDLVITQKGVTDNFILKSDITQTIVGQSENLVASEKAVKNAISAIPQFSLEGDKGQSISTAMTQKATTDAINEVAEASIQKSSIASTTGNSTTSVMSQKAVTDAILTAQTIFNMIYPVDSIYMSMSSVNPGTIFGGNVATN